MARNTKLAAIFGHPTELFGHLRFTQSFVIDFATGRRQVPPHEALQWRPGALTVHTGPKGRSVAEISRVTQRSYLMLRNRWVYVFVYKGAKNTTSWFLELFVDPKGEIHINPARDPSTRLQWDPPGTSATGTLAHELPRAVTGRKWLYALIGTPLRLTDACLSKLESGDAVTRLTTPVDISDQKYLTRQVAEHNVPRLTLPVLLPFDVARQLSHDILVTQPKRANLLGLDGDPGEAATAKQVETAKKYFFARGLHTVVDHPKLGETLEKHFQDGNADTLRTFVTDFERRVDELDLLAASVGADLSRWMERELVQILLGGVLPAEGSALLRIIDEVTAGLSQTVPGMVCLSRFCEPSRAGTFMHRFFSGGALAGADAEIAREGIESFVKAYGSIQKARLVVDHEDAVHRIASELQHTFGAVGLDWRPDDLEVRTAFIDSVTLQHEGKPGQPGAQELIVEAKAVNAKTAALQKAFGRVDLFLALFDTLNFALALRAYMNTAEDTLRTERGLAAAAAGSQVFAGLLDNVFDLVGRKNVHLGARFAVRSLGVLASVHSLHVAVKDRKEALARGDYDAALFAISSGTIGFSGALAPVVAKGALGGWIGLGLAALAGVAYMAYLYLKDSDLETFVLHCGFGKQALRRESTAHPRWSPVPLSALAKDWEQQSIALGSLQRQFALGFGERARIPPGAITPYFNARVYVGHVDMDTTFEVTWRWHGFRGEANAEERQVWIAARRPGTKGDPFGERLRFDANGEIFYDLPIPKRAMNDSGIISGQHEFRFLRVLVQKTYAIPGRSKRVSVPPNAPLELTLQEGSVEPNSSVRVLSVGE
jgi:hypothetical protein